MITYSFTAPKINEADLSWLQYKLVVLFRMFLGIHDGSLKEIKIRYNAKE